MKCLPLFKKNYFSSFSTWQLGDIHDQYQALMKKKKKTRNKNVRLKPKGMLVNSIGKLTSTAFKPCLEWRENF